MNRSKLRFIAHIDSVFPNSFKSFDYREGRQTHFRIIFVRDCLNKVQEYQT